MNNPPETPSSFLSSKKIVIVGAGISGLSFALSLQRFFYRLHPNLPGPSITIFERDTLNPSTSRQGYSLSLRSDPSSGGIQVLQKLGLLPNLLQNSVTGKKGGTFCIWDSSFSEILQVQSRKKSSEVVVPHMRIARNVLRQTMVDALHPTVAMKWGTTVTGAIHLSNDRVGVQLGNGEISECDILIAADGSRSKIRTGLRPEDKLQFLKTICITGHAKFDGEVPRPADKDWGLVLSGTGTGLFVGPVDEGSVVWNLSYLSPEPRTINMAMSQEEKGYLIKEVLERGKGFSEPFATYLKATDLMTLAVFNAMDKQPFAHTFPGLEHGNMIFIGDSNHAMSPFAGNGANMALVDGWELAEQLCKQDSLQTAVAAYDALSVPRSKRALRFSHWTIWILHSKGWRYIFWIYMFWVLRWLLTASQWFR